LIGDLRVRLRPFRQRIDPGDVHPIFELEGAVEGDEFVVRALGQRVALPTLEVGADAKGPYGSVEQCERDLPDGFTLRLHRVFRHAWNVSIGFSESHAEFSEGGEISLVRDGEARSRALQARRAAGLNPAFPVGIQPEVCISMEFDDDGLMKGISRLLPSARSKQRLS
jgi:hypothetical protein